MKKEKNWLTYCNIGVNFIFLPIFTDESAAELVHARRHYLKPLMALGEHGLECFYLLLQSIQTSHLGWAARVGKTLAWIFSAVFGFLQKSQYAALNTMNRWLPEKMAITTSPCPIVIVLAIRQNSGVSACARTLSDGTSVAPMHGRIDRSGISRGGGCSLLVTSSSFESGRLDSAAIE